MYDSGEYFLDVLYDLTRFFLFVIFAWNLFKKFIMPYCADYFKKVCEDLKSIETKQKIASREQSTLEEKLSEQERICKTLEGKIKLWQAREQEIIDEKKSMHLEWLAQLQTKKEKQYERFTEQKIQKAALLSALVNTQAYFQENYKGESGKKLLSTFVQSLENRPSLPHEK